MRFEYTVSVAGLERFRSVEYRRALAVCDRLNGILSEVEGRRDQSAGMSVSIVETIDDYCDVDCCDTQDEDCHCGDCPACAPLGCPRDQGSCGGPLEEG
jgi:hypothetical protein